MASVLITGGNGIIGTYLSRKLIENGHRVGILSRTKVSIPGIQSFIWDIKQDTIDKEAIEFADYIIHLSGTNIGEKKWTPDRITDIFESRIKSAKMILEKMRAINKKPIAFITASAVGYYGAVTSDKIFTENDPPSEDLLGLICNEWELASELFSSYGVRVVQIRTGIVLTSNGGALAKMAVPVKYGIAAALGSGKQYMPWIHIHDLCNIYIKAINDTQMNGAYNAVAPEHVTNKVFTKVLAQVLEKPYFLPNIPAAFLKLIFGEMAILFLFGSRISSQKIKDAGYQFVFPDLKSALRDLFKLKNN